MRQASGTMLCSSGFSSGKGRPYRIPTTRRLAATTRITSRAALGPPHVWSVGGCRATDQLGDVPRPNDHGVDAGALESDDVVPAGELDLRDRQLPRGDVREQVEHSVE